MDELSRLAGQLDAAAATLAETARRLPGLVTPGTALGVDGSGRPGEIGRALHARLTAALEARAGEATAAADRLADTAQAVRAAAAHYADTEDAADRRHRRGR